MALRNVEHIDLKSPLLTETEYVQSLQEIVSKISNLIFKDIAVKKSSGSFLKSSLFSRLAENNIIDDENNINEKKLESHCRLAALFLVLETFRKSNIENAYQKSRAATDRAYYQLPEIFRNFLDHFSCLIDKNRTTQIIDCLTDIADYPADIIGNVYNNFSHNEHQQNHGQHFTQCSEADILNAFCINKKTSTVLDSSCGSGTFLLRAFYFQQHFHPGISEEKLMGNLTGVDISSYAVYLTTINFFLKNKSLPHENILKENFLKISIKKNKLTKKQFSFFDACVGNPPFIRHEAMDDKHEWLTLIKKEYGISYISGQSDQYIYFLIHTLFFLKEGGRLGYVIAASWLDVQFGTGLQKFLLAHFKIITIIDYQAKRSFGTASVNTVLLVVEKCKDEAARKNNPVKFVRLFSDYEKIIGSIESESRITNAIKFAVIIENSTEKYLDKNFQVDVIKQEKLTNSSIVNGQYTNGYWGANYLRSPRIYNKIISNVGKKFVPLSDIVEVKYGIKTGANDFFYLRDETAKALNLSDEDYEKTFGHEKEKHQHTWEDFGWYFSGLNNKHFVLEKEFIIPVFKTQKEASKLDVNVARLKFVVLHCNVSKEILRVKNKKILHYINFAEKEYNLHKRPSVSGRRLWYDLTSSLVKGDFIFPSKIGEKYRLIDNRTARVVCDKVNYVIQIKDGFKKYGDELFLILNSISFRYFIDLFARQLTGSQTISDVDVNLLKKTLIPHPANFSSHSNSVETLVKEIKSREQLALSKEILQEDKLKIDLAIFKTIGLSQSDLRQLYKESASYIENRQIKSDSLKK